MINIAEQDAERLLARFRAAAALARSVDTLRLLQQCARATDGRVGPKRADWERTWSLALTWGAHR